MNNNISVAEDMIGAYIEKRRQNIDLVEYDFNDCFRIVEVVEEWNGVPLNMQHPDFFRELHRIHNSKVIVKAFSASVNECIMVMTARNLLMVMDRYR